MMAEGTKKRVVGISSPLLPLLFLVCVVGLFLAPAAEAQDAAPARSAPAGDVENGKKLFNTIGCWQCHGYSGQGGSGPKIAPDPIPYPAFNRYVRKPSGSMPPYSPKVVADSALADIYSFLLTIPKPPDPDAIPLLNSD
jgi:mono/diheme cytochrome c family protein